MMLAIKAGPQIAAKVGNPAGLLWSVPANLVFRRKIGGARDNGIPPRSTPDVIFHQMYYVRQPLCRICDRSSVYRGQHIVMPKEWRFRRTRTRTL